MQIADKLGKAKDELICLGDIILKLLEAQSASQKDEYEKLMFSVRL